jgi:lysosomal acid lipase/cholesteryl ester hydrolase
MHRIPCGKIGCAAQGGLGRGQPVYLHHGLITSSVNWIISGPGKGLAYTLADAGYDVWLGNSRGNTYSRRHVTYSNKNKEFWDFSWHKMAIFDIPAVIDYIYNIKNDGATKSNTLNNLIYIGHSMGTTILFAMLAELPEYNQKIRMAIALGPIAYIKHVKSPIRRLAPYIKDIDMIIRFFGANEFFPYNNFLHLLSKYSDLSEAVRFMYINTVSFIFGFEKTQFNETLLPIFLRYYPAGTSTKTVVHYLQELKNHGKFQKYDHGKERNMKEYGQDYPPVYNVTAITTPIALFYTTNDWLIDPSDVKLLFKDLAKSVNVPVMKLMERYR